MAHRTVIFYGRRYPEAEVRVGALRQCGLDVTWLGGNDLDRRHDNSLFASYEVGRADLSLRDLDRLLDGAGILHADDGMMVLGSDLAVGQGVSGSGSLAATA